MWVSGSMAFANDLAYLCLEYKVYLGKKKKKANMSHPLSRGTTQTVLLIKHPASPEPLVSGINDLNPGK